MSTEKDIQKEYEELKDIKTTEDCPEIQFFPRRIGLGYKVEYKHIDKSIFKPLKNKKPPKKLKRESESNSEDAPKRGSKK